MSRARPGIKGIQPLPQSPPINPLLLLPRPIIQLAKAVQAHLQDVPTSKVLATSVCSEVLVLKSWSPLVPTATCFNLSLVNRDTRRLPALTQQVVRLVYKCFLYRARRELILQPYEHLGPQAAEVPTLTLLLGTTALTTPVTDVNALPSTTVVPTEPPSRDRTRLENTRIPHFFE